MNRASFRYAPTAEARRAIHSWVAGRIRGAGDVGLARAQLADQWLAAEAWGELADWLAKWYVVASGGLPPERIADLWRAIERNSPRRAIDAYRPLWDVSGDDPEAVEDALCACDVLLRVLTLLGHHPAAARLADTRRAGDNHPAAAEGDGSPGERE